MESFNKIIEILSYRGHEDLGRLFRNSNYELNESSTYGSRLFSVLTSVEIYSPLPDHERIMRIGDSERGGLLSAFQVIYPTKDSSPEIVGLEFFVDPSAPIPKKKRPLHRLEEIDFSYIAEQIEKADQKILLGDYEGAITNSRNLIETICKYILSKCGKTYKEGEKLPKLYKQTSKLLNMDPSSHEEEFFKETLSGCFSVVSGLARIRNELSDSHGKSPNIIYRAAKRHAVLCVSVSQAITDYLYSSYVEVLKNDES